MNRQEMTRLGGIGLKFTPNSRHVRIHRSGLGVEIITPRGIQNSITSERAINILKKVHQQVILGRRYFHGLAAPGYLPAADIDRHTSAKRNIWSATFVDLLGVTVFPWLGSSYLPGRSPRLLISIT
jgi:hypothetical protein